MSFTHTVRSIYEADGLVASSSAVAVTADAEDNRDIAVPGPSTDLVVNIAIAYASLKAFLLVCDVAVTVNVNSLQGTDGILTLAAGAPIIYRNGGSVANPLAHDVTTFHVVSAGSVAGTLTVRVLQDSTP